MVEFKFPSILVGKIVKLRKANSKSVMTPTFFQFIIFPYFAFRCVNFSIWLLFRKVHHYNSVLTFFLIKKQTVCFFHFSLNVFMIQFKIRVFLLLENTILIFVFFIHRQFLKQKQTFQSIIICSMLCNLQEYYMSL